jgi:hypothetical protein
VSRERSSFTWLAVWERSSAVLVQAKGSQRSFQPSMNAPIAVMRSLTDVYVPRRMAWRVMMPKKISINGDHVEPGSGRRGEMQDDPGILVQPGPHLRVLVVAVVV